MNHRVAISLSYLDAESRLPQTQQKKSREFLSKFMANPTSPGLNYECIKQAKDPNLRSLRIDKSYRAIVMHPPAGDVYVVLWVDKHDDAYTWACKYRCGINPKVGNLQLFAVEEIVAPKAPLMSPEGAAPTFDAPAQDSLFHSVDDDTLTAFGVPPMLLPSVRALKNDEDLDSVAPYLPSDAREALYFLAAGYSPEEVLEELSRPKPPATVDVEDFSTALDHPVSKATFAEVKTQDELEAILNAPLEQWRRFLHPSQEQLVRWNTNGPVHVLGGAGTGKTVVLIHRAKRLLSEVFPEGRILVTTFTRNLANDIAETLKGLCSVSETSRLDVMNIHAWAKRYLSKGGKTYRVASPTDRDKLFRQAVNEKGQKAFPLSFFREEWERVVQDHDVTERSDYLLITRVGRGTPLSRRDRAAVWAVFERYRTLLNLERLVEMDDLIREARLDLEANPGKSPYCAVLTDEIQDFRTADLKLLRALVPKGPSDLFLVGDNYQRIYPRTTSLAACGIEVRGRSRHLKVNYRTTQQIRNWAVCALRGEKLVDLDEGAGSLKGYHSLRQGAPPTVEHFAAAAEEGKEIVARVRAWLGEGVPAEHVCLTARTNELLTDRYQPLLKDNGIACQVLDSDGSAAVGKGVRLATMHRMKGLEFPRVIIAGINADTLPLKLGYSFPDEASREDFELGERCLLYVAATRARDLLAILGWGTRSPIIG